MASALLGHYQNIVTLHVHGLLQDYGMNLWQRMEIVAHKATNVGSLRSINNTLEVVEDNGVNFVLRYAPALSEKTKQPKLNTKVSPFSPPDEALLVESIDDNYNLVLNKFNVLPCHGLLTTKTFVEQTELLKLEDFQAISQVLQQVDGFIFFNGGQRAGASQQHRHFQLVPKDLGFGELPVSPVIEQWHSHKLKHVFPFAYRSYWLPDYTAETLLDAWLKMEFSWQPYNLLITRQWMLVIPRAQESVHGISVNSLGFAGALLVTTDEQRRYVYDHGPMHILAQVSRPAG